MQGFHDAPTNVGVGRIVHFSPPKDAEDSSAVTCGTAVIDAGEHAGQRVEFEASQCYAYGHSLAKADLSQVFNESKTHSSHTVWEVG